MNKLNSYTLKKIIVAVPFAFIFSFLGGFLSNSLNNALIKENSYSLTTFNSIISTPSAEQLNKFKNNKEAFNGIFYAYNYDSKISANNTSYDGNVLFSNNIEDYKFSLFNNNNLITGNLDKPELLVDEALSSKLNLKIGDSVTFAINNKTYTLNVTSIHLSCHYPDFDNGLAIAKWTSEMDNDNPKAVRSGLAFAEYKDDAKAAATLNNYLPLGKLIDKDTYISDWKKDFPQRPGESTADYLKRQQAAYDLYFENFKDTYKDSKTLIKSKESSYSNLNQIVKGSKENIFRFTILGSISGVIIYLILNTIIVFSNLKNDRNKDNVDLNERKIFKRELKQNCYISLGLFLISTLVNLLVANVLFFSLNNFVLQIVMYSLAPIMALILSAIISKIYSINVFKKK